MRRREFIGGFGGATALASFAAYAQRTIPVIGFMHSGTAEQNANRLVGFRNGLAEGGFVEGRNLAIEYRWAKSAAG